MWIVLAVFALIIISILYEYRLRKPDQLVLYESAGKINLRKGRLYPRHLSLVLPKTIHSAQLNIDASAKGNLDIKVKLAMSVALSLDHVDRLIKTGGWNGSAVQKATKELEVVVHSLAREFTENFEVEELSSQKIYEYLNGKLDISKEKFGLEVISVSVQSFEIMDAKIADAIRQQESARIFEQTEELNQKARITAAKARLDAEEQIARRENEIELRKYELKKAELEKESGISEMRVKEELKRKKMQLEYEREELALLKNNPELLILTPQAARLAEASQALKNARTVVSLSPNDIARNSELAEVFQNLLQNLTNRPSKGNDKPEGISEKKS
jgi:hypothetical protein